MTKRKPAKLSENERLHILLSIAERKVQNLKAENERRVERYNSIIDQQLSVIADLKAEVERLHERIAHGDRHTNTLCNLKAEIQEENERLKAENERLRASSFVTAVPSEDYEKLKAEVERLRKAGDAMAIDCAEWCMSDQCTGSGFFTLEETMENLPSLIAWNAAKQPPTDQTK